MVNRALLVALAGVGASWLMTLLVLGSNGLQYAVSGELMRAFTVPMAQVAAAGAAFLAALGVGWRIGLARDDLRAVLGALLILDAAIVLVRIALVGALGLSDVVALFLVATAWGLQFVAVALAVLLAGRAEPVSTEPRTRHRD